MIRAAMVGIGRWGRTLVGSVQGKSEAFRFTAGHNRTRANAAAFCAEHGLKLADSLDEILADPAIDAVVFATPHSEHGPQVERAAAAGKHVFMEKPFTLDRHSAARALDAVARAGIVLGVAYPRRFHPNMRELKRRVDDGRLGTIAHCHAEQNSPAGLFMDPRSWRADPEEAPAGGMTAMGVHNVDAMIGLFGAIDEVYATSIRRTVTYNAEDTTSVIFGLANGMSASLLSCLATAVSYRMAVFGSKGCAELVSPELDFRFTPTPDAMPAGRHTQPAPEVIENRGANTLLAELEAFAGAISGSAPYPIPADQILHGVAVFEA
ncbi:MAG TPA: Gfo/Idh/MocA family oxidoreductase, partial [Stellaceae bacterium]|nr:Gfo/Idh/MocA family oxidoreductase [Stellaceae bacterium]